MLRTIFITHSACTTTTTTALVYLIAASVVAGTASSHAQGSHVPSAILSRRQSFAHRSYRSHRDTPPGAARWKRRLSPLARKEFHSNSASSPSTLSSSPPLQKKTGERERVSESRCRRNKADEKAAAESIVNDDRGRKYDPVLKRREMSSLLTVVLPALTMMGDSKADEQGLDWKSTVGMERPRRRFEREEEFFPLRFVTYLSRFLLNFDEQSRKFWDNAGAAIPLSYSASQVREARLKQYGEFAASVEFGLKPFNSRKGIDELLNILSLKFTSPSAKRQLSILFSFVQDRQPVQDITRLLAEADNATVSQILVEDSGRGFLRPPQVTLTAPIGRGVRAKAKAIMETLGPIGAVNITDPGNGYLEAPLVEISPPQEGGRQAKAIAVVEGGHIKAIRLTDRGDGYSYNEKVSVKLVKQEQEASSSSSSSSSSSAVPYDEASSSQMKQRISSSTDFRPATVKPLLELCIKELQIVDGGSSYANEQGVLVNIASPQDSLGLEDGAPARAVATLKKRPIKKTSGETLPYMQLPSSSISQQLTQLIPDSIIPYLDSTSGRYEVKVPFDDVSSSWLLDKEARCGGSLDPAFGPRGCMPVEREKELDALAYGKFAISGALCAAVSHAVLTPLEVVKTKVQMEPEANVVDVVKGTFSMGPAALFRGIGPTAAGFFVGGSMSFGLTELFRRLFAETVGPSNAVLYEVPIVISASITAVIFACIGVVPFEAVRIKLQSDDNFADGLVGGFKRLSEESGIVGFYEGLGAILFKEIPFALCKFAVFDAACSQIYDRYPAAREALTTALIVSVIGGAISGAVSAVVSHPADTVLTTLYSGGEGGGDERGGGDDDVDRSDLLAAVRRITDERGVQGLFAGLIPRMIFAASLLALEFLLYDYLKVLLGVSPDDLGQYLDVLGTFR